MSARLPARVPAQLVLLAMGFVGSEERLFEEFKLAKAPNGSIAADDSSYATSVPGVLPLVTHVADRAWWCGLLPKGVAQHMRLINFCVSKL